MVNGGVRAAIREWALELGFAAIGFAPASLAGAAREHLHGYVAAGFHGDMGWLARDVDRRADPAVLWPEARSAIVLAANYAPAGDPLANLARGDRATLSVYARGDDYHDVLKRRVKQLARRIAQAHGAGVKVFVDTAPVMEKPLAQAAGLGWQGKHTNLVSREFGSWLFLAEILTTLALEPDAPGIDHCGSCQRCLDICPTRAFPAPYRLDARRCISYLTIEHKGTIAPEFRAAMGNRIYGCDDCLAVCPWNKYARATGERAFMARAELGAPRLADLAELDDRAFRVVFRASPVKRIGRDRFVRNVMIAIGNSGEPALLDVVIRRLDDGSSLVRAMAVWALGRLAPPDRLVPEMARAGAERDGEVLAEWAALMPMAGRAALPL